MGPEITICVCKPDYFIITLKLCLQKTRLLHYIKAVYIKTDHLNGQNIICLLYTSGYYYTASMTAQILTPVLSGAVMEFIGYRYLFLYAFIFGVITLIPLLFVHHGDVMKMEETAPQPTGQMSGGLQENGVSSSYSAS